MIVSLGGTAMHSDIDFASEYLRHRLVFTGLHDVSFIGADQLMRHEEAALTDATQNGESA